MGDAVVFSSGMSRRGDFRPALAVNHDIGIDINEMRSAAVKADFAAAFVASSSRLFVDSGAFAHNRAVKRGKARSEAVNFDRVFDEYNALLHAICVADGGGDEAACRVSLVMPDVVGDQAASVELWRRYRDEMSWFHAIVPLQAGELSLVELYDVACEILGVSGGLDVGIPSNVMAASDAEFAELMRERGDDIYSVHVLGAASEMRAAGRIAAIEAADYDGAVSFDAHRVRSYWKYCSRKEALERLLAGMPPMRKAEAAGQAELFGGCYA